MRWEAPEILLLLWIAPLAAVISWRAAARWRQAAGRFAAPEMHTRLLPMPSRRRTAIKSALFVAGVSLFIVAAARPQWGEYFEDVQSQGLDMYIALDVSQSMLAEDVAPNRLERAKADIRDLLERLAGDRVGLIAFAGVAIQRVPLTTDHEFILAALEDLSPDAAPRGGSSIGDAIRKALECFEQRADRDRVILMISDGEDHDSFPEEAASAAASAGVAIIALGVGDPEVGHPIPVRRGEDFGLLTHDGQEVRTRLDETLLRKIAMATGGAYVPARTRAYDLGELYEQQLAGRARSEVKLQRQQRFHERYQWFAFLGLISLLIDLALPRYPRRKATPTPN